MSRPFYYYCSKVESLEQSLEHPWEELSPPGPEESFQTWPPL